MKTRMSAVEGAKLLRTTLKQTFPGTKFSVVLSRGTAYGYCDVTYKDGPALADVNRIADGFEGKGFDGMIDLAYRKNTSYCPVHGARFAGTEGTAGSGGVVSATGLDGLGEHSVLCCEKAALVDFGLRGVMVTRELSPEGEAFLVDVYNTRQGHPELEQRMKVSTYDGSPYYTVHRKCDPDHVQDAGYQYRDMVRAADLRDPAKLMREAKAHHAEVRAQYAKWDEEFKVKQAAKLKEQAAKELRSEQKELKAEQPARTQPNLN
jgi:hypothetical protein